jgi:hypothetical protein
MFNENVTQAQRLTFMSDEMKETFKEKYLHKELDALGINVNNLTGNDICRLLDISKWNFANHDEQERCHKYITDLCRKHGVKWVHRNRFKVINDFNEGMEQRKQEQKLKDRKKKKKKLLAKLLRKKSQ